MINGRTDLCGRVAIVTGAGSGLGAATSALLAECGSRVAGLDLAFSGRDVRTRVEVANDHDILALECDVADESSVFRAVETVKDNWGSIDFAINCAGIDHTLSLEAMTIDQWDQVLGVNLRGPFLVSKAVFPAMRQQGFGHIVNVASTASLRAWSDVSAYAASKWGLVGFSRAIGVEGRPFGIRVTTVIPGGMKTRFFDRFAEQGIPMPDEERLQDPASIAGVILNALTLPPESVMQEVLVTPLDEPSWP